VYAQAREKVNGMGGMAAWRKRERESMERRKDWDKEDRRAEWEMEMERLRDEGMDERDIDEAFGDGPPRERERFVEDDECERGCGDRSDHSGEVSLLCTLSGGNE
jgi:hypothetical protein